MSHQLPIRTSSSSSLTPVPSIAQLNSSVPTGKQLLDENPRHPAKRWIDSAKMLFEKAQEYRLLGQLEMSYVTFFKAITITIEVIPKSNGYRKDDPDYKELCKRSELAFSIIETIKTKLQSKYQDYMNNQQLDSIKSDVIPTGSVNSQTSSPERMNATAKVSQKSTVMPASTAVPINRPTTVRTVVSCAELLQVLEEKKKTVLILDVRVVEEYFLGHVRPSSSTWVVNIEPDWLNQPNLTAAEIEAFLGKYGSSLPQQHFASRHLVDFIVVMDHASASPQTSPVLQSLLTCINEFGLPKIPKNTPLGLCGGFQAWKAFLESKRSSPGYKGDSEWIELADGRSASEKFAIPPRKRSLSGVPDALLSNGSISASSALFESRPQQIPNTQPSPLSNGVVSSGNIERKSSKRFDQPFYSYDRPSREFDAEVTYPSLQNSSQSQPPYKRDSITDMDSFQVRYPDIQPSITGKIEPPKIPPKPVALSGKGNQISPHSSASDLTAIKQSTSPLPPTQLKTLQSQSSMTNLNSQVQNLSLTSSEQNLSGSPQSKISYSHMASRPPSTSSTAPINPVQLPSQPVVSRNNSQQLLMNGHGGAYPAQSQPLNMISPQTPSYPIQASSAYFSQQAGRIPLSHSYPSYQNQSQNQIPQQSPPHMAGGQYNNLPRPVYPNQQQVNHGYVQPPAMGNMNMPQPVQRNTQTQGQIPQSTAMMGPRVDLKQYPATQYQNQPRIQASAQLTSPQMISPPIPPLLAASTIRRSSSPSPSPVTNRYYEPLALVGSNSHIGPQQRVPDLSAQFIPSATESPGIAGLKNLGNTCFMNSIIQCLNGMYPITRYFSTGSYRRHVNPHNPLGSKGKMVESFVQLLRTMASPEENVVVPSVFKSVIGSLHASFAGGEQQDSQEFLAFLLDSLHEDLNLGRRVADKSSGVRERVPVPDSELEKLPDGEHMRLAWENYKIKNWSIIVDLFQGTLKSRLECLTCGKISVTFNPFMYLTLPIPEKNVSGVKGGPVFLNECLRKFTEIEILDGEDAWTCPSCKTKRKASKQLTIAKLPIILLVHLKRFYFQGPFRNKVETYVEFPTKSLDLTELVRDTNTGMGQKSVYDLYAVSNHFGGLNGGHYTAQVKSHHQQQWYNFDDSRVSPCPEKSVKSSAAYILFYVQGNPQGYADWWSADSKI